MACGNFLPMAYERLHDVTGGVASLNFDATELKIFYGNLGSPSNPNLHYERFETYHFLPHAIELHT